MRVLLLAALTIGGCKKPGAPDAPPITETFRDDFERASLGDVWHPTAESYHIKDGALSAKGAYNHPLWLHRKLPEKVAIEFDAWSNTPDGDIKIEFFGDGTSFARDKGQYTSTGYVAVMGGWGNSLSILAQGNEHGSQLVKRSAPKVEKGKKYRWKITRDGDAITWEIDGEVFLELRDRHRLYGEGHYYFGFNNWQSDSWFDNLVIEPLD
jgi:hypothetical protein